MTYIEVCEQMKKEAAMEKKAFPWLAASLLATGLMTTIGGAIGAGYNVGTNAALIHLGVNSALGLGGGALLAKATSKGQQDVEDIKKEYEAERLKTDIGELQTKMNQEARARKRMQQPQSMRLI